MKFDKKAVMEEKLEGVRGELKELEQKYDRDMVEYEMREKYLKASLTSLQMFLKDFARSKEPQKEAAPFATDKDLGEDDGQVY
jgi:hypothetical protein